ncbi:hypothetical protein TKK_0007814 [Trichogramma kaykai]
MDRLIRTQKKKQSNTLEITESSKSESSLVILAPQRIFFEENKDNSKVAEVKASVASPCICKGKKADDTIENLRNDKKVTAIFEDNDFEIIESVKSEEKIEEIFNVIDPCDETYESYMIDTDDMNYCYERMLQIDSKFENTSERVYKGKDRVNKVLEALNLDKENSHDEIINLIKEGLCQVSNRYGKANNSFMKDDYNPDERTIYLAYFDVNNLYGHAMSQALPTGGFEWITEELDETDDDTEDEIADNPKIGYILEVDLEYPKELHDAHKDLPFLPEHKSQKGSKFTKLMTTLDDKEKYVIHYQALEQAVKHGLIMNKIHRILKFNQSAWLKKSKRHNLTTEKMNKLALSPYDDKRFIIPGQTDTIPWSHYSIARLRLQQQQQNMENNIMGGERQDEDMERGNIHEEKGGNPMNVCTAGLNHGGSKRFYTDTTNDEISPTPSKRIKLSLDMSRRSGKRTNANTTNDEISPTHSKKN